MQLPNPSFNRLCLYSDITSLNNLFCRQHQGQITVFSSELCAPVPSGILSTDYQPGCLKHFLIHPRRRLLLPEWHPCSQPVLDYMWTLCTVPCNKQPGYDRAILVYKDSLTPAHLITHVHTILHRIFSIVDNYKNWRKTVERNPLYVLTISGPVFLAVDTFLLLG